MDNISRIVCKVLPFAFAEVKLPNGRETLQQVRAYNAHVLQTLGREPTLPDIAQECWVLGFVSRVFGGHMTNWAHMDSNGFSKFASSFLWFSVNIVGKFRSGFLLKMNRG